MSVTIPGITSVTTQTAITDYYVAPGLRSDSIDKSLSPGIRLPAHDLGDTSSSMKELGGRRAANKQRMAKIGDIVRTIVQSSTNTDNLLHFEITTTTDRISDTIAVVPDSLFTVPAGYTKTTPAAATSALIAVP